MSFQPLCEMSRGILFTTNNQMISELSPGPGHRTTQQFLLQFSSLLSPKTHLIKTEMETINIEQSCLQLTEMDTWNDLNEGSGGLQQRKYVILYLVISLYSWGEWRHFSVTRCDDSDLGLGPIKYSRLAGYNLPRNFLAREIIWWFLVAVSNSIKFSLSVRFCKMILIIQDWSWVRN